MTNVLQCSLLLILSLFFSGCWDTFQAEYADPKGLEIVDDRWSSVDARKTSEILVGAMLSKPWLSKHSSQRSGAGGDRRPVVIVNDIENRTNEHIDTKALREALRDELINSGRIRFVNAQARERILKEIKYQNESGHVRGDTASRRGRQTGADYFLGGEISSYHHERDGYKIVTYQTILRLTNLESGEFVWSKKYEIKKRFKRSMFGF